MIIKRLLSILFDLISSIFPAFGCYLGGLDFIYSFIFFYITAQIVEIIYFKGITAGMLILKIQPQNNKDTPASLLKILFYQLIVSIVILNVFNPATNIFTNILLTLVLITPYYARNRYNSVIDLIFCLNWIPSNKPNYKTVE